MTYNGFEVFFLTLGNADSIFIRHYNFGVKTTVLIDAGYKRHASIIGKFLQDLGEPAIDHLVCSHHHEDHAAGLVDLVQDRTVTIRKAWVHTGALAIDRINRAQFYSFGSLVRRIQASKDIQKELLTALQNRLIPIDQPFTGKNIGPLLVLSPSIQFYNAQLELMRQESVAQALNQRYMKREMRDLLESVLGKSTEAEEDREALGGEPTSPENEISTVLALPNIDNNNVSSYFLLTSDAGTAALTEVKQISETLPNYIGFLRSLRWMQLPHHGSRRNLNKDLIDYFSPRTAFVSAEGSRKHPSIKLVNTVKEGGGKVYSTHYPEKCEGGWVRQKQGNVPELKTTPATPLWEAAE